VHPPHAYLQHLVPQCTPSSHYIKDAYLIFVLDEHCIFRCECCSKAYCEDCLPAEAVIQGESRRMESLGYRMVGNACYILCSLPCQQFYSTEVEPQSTAAAAQPHQLQLVEQYQHEGADSTAKGTGPGGLPHSTSVTSVEPDTPVATSVGHALNNCALDDIRDRLGFEKSADAVLLYNGALPSSVGVNHKLNTRLAVRFANLGEIPNFHIRLSKTSARIKSLLYKLVRDVERFQSVYSTKSGTRTETKDASAAEEDAAEDVSPEDTHLSVEKLQAEVFNHKGVNSDLSVEAIGRVFLHVVGSLARAYAQELYPLAEVLGLCHVLPIIRPPKPGSSQAAPSERFLYEPKFW
jgi:hypothetical protein